MKILTIRHGDFSPTNGGKPTPKTLQRFLVLLKRLREKDRLAFLACSNVRRTQELSIRSARKFELSLVVFEEFNPLETTKWPSIFGGWLYELLHRWQFFNHLCLILWWIGLPIFTEGPAQFLERTKLGLEKLRATAKATDKVLLICHQETIIALRMIINKEMPIRAFNFKRRIKHLEVVSFEIK